MNKTIAVLGAAICLAAVNASANTTYDWVPDGNDGPSSGTIVLNGTTLVSYAFSWTPNGNNVTPISDNGLTLGAISISGVNLLFTASTTSTPSGGTWNEDGASLNDKFQADKPQGNGKETINGQWVDAAALGDDDDGGPNGGKVPDGGMTVTLLGMGMAGLGWLRRRMS